MLTASTQAGERVIKIGGSVEQANAGCRSDRFIQVNLNTGRLSSYRSVGNKG